jgi:hypothetical protein
MMNICSKYEIAWRNICLCKIKIKLWLNLNNVEQIHNDCWDKKLIKINIKAINDNQNRIYDVANETTEKV